MTGPDRFVELLTGPLVDMEGRSGGFFRAHHYAHLIRTELLPAVRPDDVPDFVAPIIVELDPDPAPTPPGVRRAVPGRTAVGLAVTLNDRVVLVWSHGLVRLRTGSTTVPYPSITAVREVLFRASGQDVLGFEIHADRRIPVLFTPQHPDMRFWREMLRLRLDGALVPTYDDIPAAMPPRVVPARPSRPAGPPHAPAVSLVEAGPPAPVRPPAPPPGSLPDQRGNARLTGLLAVLLLVAGLVAGAAIWVARPSSSSGSTRPAAVDPADDAACGIRASVTDVAPAAADADVLSLQALLLVRSTCEAGVRITGDIEVVLRGLDGEVARGRGPAGGLLLTPTADADLTVRFRLGAYRFVPVGPVEVEVLADVEPAPADAPSTGEILPVGADTPADADRAARDVLVAQASTDAADVERAAGTWAVQLASGRPGTVRNGQVLGYRDLLAQHLALRADDPAHVRLLWSGDWTTFASRDFHVTVLPLGDSDPMTVNARCEALRHDVDDCFAKFLSHVHGPDGATVRR